MIEKEVSTHSAPEGQCYLVLGMHRSATSALALALERIGVRMNGGRHHCEDLEIMRLNDRILRRADGSWSNPPLPNAVTLVAPYFRDEIAAMVQARIEAAKKESKGLWGFKDPRTILTYDLWRPHLGTPLLFSVMRNPADVARSLQKRNGFSMRRGIELANTYNQRLLAILSRNFENPENFA